ncbi:hypothetical protein Tco_0516654 [Tanacetum coccineum]
MAHFPLILPDIKQGTIGSDAAEDIGRDTIIEVDKKVEEGLDGSKIIIEEDEPRDIKQNKLDDRTCGETKEVDEVEMESEESAEEIEEEEEDYPKFFDTFPTIEELGYENPICTLGDYSKSSYEGYQNTIELPEGNNVMPLRSDTIRLVKNKCSFHGLRFEDPNQHLKDFFKLVDSLDLDVANKERTRLRLFQFSFRDQASNWLEHLLAGSISTWEDLTTRFVT